MKNKILFLCHAQEAHHFDTLYHGFMQLFGFENVFDYPICSKNHSNHLNKDVYKWWTFNDNPNSTLLSMEQWAKLINEHEIKYIIGHSRAIDNLIRIISLINDDVFKNICIAFYEEEHDLGFELHRNYLEKLKDVYHRIDIHYRVDYVKKSVGSYDKIKPAYIAGPLDKLLSEVGSKIKPFEERKYDICYMVGSSHPNRKAYYDLLKKEFKDEKSIILYGGYAGAHKLSISEYFTIINDSKIFISARGNEYSNTRNIEGPLLGAALFTEKLVIDMPLEFNDGQNAVFFDANNLIIKLNEYIKQQDKLKELVHNSFKWAMNHHTTTARANQMVELAYHVKGWQ